MSIAQTFEYLKKTGVVLTFNCAVAEVFIKSTCGRFGQKHQWPNTPMLFAEIKCLRCGKPLEEYLKGK